MGPKVRPTPEQLEEAIHAAMLDQESDGLCYSVLSCAIEEKIVSEAELAQHFDVNPSRIESWKQGDDLPELIQRPRIYAYLFAKLRPAPRGPGITTYTK